MTLVQPPRFLFSGVRTPVSVKPHVNKMTRGDLPVHDWYRFVLSFPPHLVRDYIARFSLRTGDTLLDPFCGTGTTLVEAKRQGLHAVGVEANWMAHFASRVKCCWDVDVEEFIASSHAIAEQAARRSRHTSEMRQLSDEKHALLLRDCIAPLPLHRTLVLLDAIDESNTACADWQRLALATSTVRYSSHLHFGPEVGVSKRKKVNPDTIGCWLEIVRRMADDIKTITQHHAHTFPADVHLGDARDVAPLLKEGSIDAVFTSPPYPNEKDYTRTTRLESVLLGFIRNKAELRSLKEGLLRSNTRNIYKNDHDGDAISHHAAVQQIAEEIEQKRIWLGKTSGFEKQYSNVVRHYFGGMARHLESLKPLLKYGAQLGYVVGDQASFLQVHIPTGEILADIAVQLGYRLKTIDLFRTRFATATRQDMREEVVVLEWKG